MGTRFPAFLLALAAAYGADAEIEDECPRALPAGEVARCVLAGSAGHTFNVEIDAAAIVLVENIGRDTILTAGEVAVGGGAVCGSGSAGASRSARAS